MADMANITVKASDGTTDVVFTKLSPSGLDGIPAVWRHEDLTLTEAQRMTFEMKSMWNGPKTARRHEMQFICPIVQDTSVSTVKQRTGEIRCKNGEWIIPTDVPNSVKLRGVHVGSNLFAAALIKTALMDGYSPS